MDDDDLRSRTSLPDSPRRSASIAALISRLMSHYWTADDPPAIRRAQAEDWVLDLIEFGPAVVEAACREWRRRPGGRRPTPGDIRALCLAEQRERREAPALPPPALDEAQAKRMADEWAIARGWMNIEHFQRESFVGASIKVGGEWLSFPGLRKV